MPLLSISKLDKAYGPDVILDEVDLVVNAGDRIGVVGPNGSGKTTLFRILTGAETADRGEISKPKSLRIAYLPQIPDLNPERTAWEEALAAVAHIQAMEPRLRALEEAMAETTDATLLEPMVEEHGHLHEAFERGGGYNLEGNARTVLAGVGLATHLHDRKTARLSGGEKCRVALARILLSDPDLLLLDEPTNHLDLAGVEWLEQYLVQRATALLVISHDRFFLDRITNRTLAFSAGSTSIYEVAYSRFEVLRQEELKALGREVEKQQAFIRKEEAFIRKHLGSQRSQEAKGRRKRLGRVEVLALPPKDKQDLKLDLSPQKRAGEVPIRLEQLTLGFGERILINALDFVLEPGERLGIVGNNGTGKSTLLKAMAGLLEPRSGRVDLGRNVELGYYDQEMASLPLDGTIYETLHNARPLWTDLQVRSFLARLLFFEEDVDRPVAQCSGGEKGRLALALMLLRRPNMLFLDEPTNHLDIPARQSLENLLDSFTGTLVVVSHDRWFLDRCTTRTLWVDADRATAYLGSFTTAASARSAAIEQRRRERDEERKKASRSSSEEKKPKPPQAKKRRPLTTVEAEIIAREDERARLLSALGTPEIYTDGSRVKAHQDRLAALGLELDALNAEWAELI